MGDIKDKFEDVFRDFVTAGVSSSGGHEPEKPEIRAIGGIIEDALAAQTLGNVAVSYDTRANLEADLAYDAGQVGLVYADATEPNNDLYIKVGASGAGSWTLTTRLHDSLEAILASTAEAETGTSTDKAITPKQRADIQLARDEVTSSALWRFQGRLPSESKDGILYVIDKDHVVIDCRPHDDQYRDGHTRRYDDIVRFELMNIANIYHALGDGAHIWIINSIWCRFKGIWVEHINFGFDTFASDQTNTGQLPSTFEPVQFVGLDSDSLATINNGGGSGPYHGNIGYSSFSLIPDGGSSIRDTMKAYDVIEFSSLVFNDNWTYKAPSGETLINVSGSRAFNPTSGHQLAVAMNLNYVSSPASKTTFGYAAMMPLRLANRLQSRLSTSAGGGTTAVQNVGAGDGSNKALGKAFRVTGWHTDHPGNCVELSMIDGLDPFRRNGVRDDYSDEAFALDQVAGPKVYIPTHGNSQDTDNETGNSLSIINYYDGVSADGA